MKVLVTGGMGFIGSNFVQHYLDRHEDVQVVNVDALKYHMAGATRTSRYEFACELARSFGFDPELVISSKMSDMGWKAKRPTDSSLDTSKVRKSLDESPYDLKTSLKALREEVETII